MNLSRIISFLLIFTLLSGFASAELFIEKYEHDTTFNGAFQETRACSCGTTTDYFTLENIGDFPATYRLELEANVGWIEMHTNRVRLESGESTTIALTLMPPCDTDEVTQYRVYATSEFGRFRVADRVVRASTCENVGLDVNPAQQSILPCSEASFELRVRNTGTFEERYHVYSNTEEITLNEQYVRLEPGESETLYAWGSWACDDYGARDVTFYADAEKNDITIARTAVVDVLWDYEYLVDVVEEENTVCAEITHERSIVLTNTASTQNTYTLTTNSPLANIGRETVTVLPGQSERVALYFNAGEQSLGQQDVTVKVRSEYGDSAQALVVPFTVQDCFEHEVIVSPAENTVCTGDATFNVQVRNRGLFTEEFVGYTSGDIYSGMTNNVAVLRTGEHVNMLLTAVVPDLDGQYDVVANVEQTPGITSQTVIPITGVSNANCTYVETPSTKLSVYKDTNVVPIIIENTGIEATTYDLFWEGKVFNLAETQMFLAPGEQAVLHLVPKNLSEVDEGRYVERFALQSHRSEYRLDFEVELSEKGFFAKLNDRLFGGAPDWCLIVFGLLLIGVVLAILFAIFVRIGAWHIRERDDGELSDMRMIFGALIVLFIIAGLVFGVMTDLPLRLAEEPMGSSYEDLYHETPMNEDYVLDISQYFVDPDGQTLEFSASQPEHVSVEIQGDTAIITPERNWYGQEFVVFTASDEDGLTADSPIMTFRVLRTHPTSVWTFIETYCRMLNMFLIAVILALVLLGLHLRKDEGLEERYGRPIREITRVERADVEVVNDLPEPSELDMPRGDMVAGDKVINVGKMPDNIFIASASGKKVHRPDCGLAQRTPKEKRVVLEGKKEALKEGYTPCRTCRPFE